MTAVVGDRRGLFRLLDPSTRPSRAELVALARSGMRGVRLTEALDLGALPTRAAAEHLAFLREAAGVGLHVLWRGRFGDLDHRPFRHLDPPRDAEGRALWPVAPAPLLTVRRGPDFALVDDRRGGALSRTYLDDPVEVDLLSDTARSCAAEADLGAAERDAVRRLASLSLFAPVRDAWVALPVRFRYART
ncbi:DUF5825 family protein [Saccharothrix xinjiangensis]|uniref:DUF5825 family protein n=1 Tax=Saccharothrix xinjiangensis TaxID=204798 RepID=A0ABV9YFX3_9PSEU